MYSRNKLKNKTLDNSDIMLYTIDMDKELLQGKYVGTIKISDNEYKITSTIHLEEQFSIKEASKLIDELQQAIEYIRNKR